MGGENTCQKVMLGNEAFARGAYEGGVEVASGYPGTPSTEILEFLSQYPEVHSRWCPNEKVALEVAAGAAIGGKRALATMKHVGLNVASDALMTLAYTGVNAGLVFIVADDPGMHSSQNEQDSRNYALFAKIPSLEPADSSEALVFTRLAFEISEEFDTPVMVRSTTRVSHSRGVVTIGERKSSPVRPYQKCASKMVMIPAFARQRRLLLEERLQKLKQWVEETPLNRVELRDPSLGIITAGVLYNYLREIAPSVSILKLGVGYPLPGKKIRAFAQQVEKLVVLEELDPIWEREIKALGIPIEGRSLFPGMGEITPDIIRERLFPDQTETYLTFEEHLLPRPPVLCAGCPHRGVFKILKDLRATVCGDIGCYTLGVLPPLSSMDTCLCMGASISVAEGIKLAHPELPVVAVIGDSTFIHAGIPPLIDTVYNKTPIVVIILDNGTTAMTGGQEHPATGKTLQGEETTRLDFLALGKAIGVPRVEKVNAYDLPQLKQTLQESLQVPHPTLLVVEGLCQLKKRERNQPFTIQEMFCLLCGTCTNIGCPAIERGETIKIAFERCAGCGVCATLCPFNAIEEVKVL